MKLRNTHVKQVKTMNASWKDNQGILSWKVTLKEKCKLLPDLGLKLLRKSFGLSTQFLMRHSHTHTHNSPFLTCMMNLSPSLFFPMPLFEHVHLRVGVPSMRSSEMSWSMLSIEVYVPYIQYFLMCVEETGNFN